MDSSYRFLRGLGRFLRDYPFLLFAAVPIVLILAVLLVILSRPEGQVAQALSQQLTALIFSLLAFAALAILVQIIHTGRRGRRFSPAKSAPALSFTEIPTIEIAIEKIVQALLASPGEANIVLYRALPVEFARDVFADTSDPGLDDLIRQYEELILNVVKEGKREKNWWDETVYGRSRSDPEFNQATFEFMAEMYFDPPKPDTTYLGLVPDFSDYGLIIVGSSPDGGRVPTEYHVAIELSVVGRRNRLAQGFVHTDEGSMARVVERFIDLRDRAMQKGRWWYIDALSEEQIAQARKETEQFFINGILEWEDA